MRASEKNTMRLAIVVAVTIALLSVPASYVFGSHVFSDVSSSAYYHKAVTAVYNASVTAGCGGTKYCPNSAVTRGQMAVFLDKLGALTVGPGGQAKPVTDALSVQGTQSFRFFQNVILGGTPGPDECTGDIPVGPVAANFGSYSLVFRIYQTPVGINPEQVNLQLRDADDAAPDDYQICLATVDGSDLPTGTYRLFGTEMVFHGQGTFGN